MTTENIDIRVSEYGSRVVRRRLDDIAAGADRAYDATQRMTDLLKTVGKYLAVTEVMRWADAWSVASSSIKIATSNSYEFVQVQTELFKVAQRSRQEFGALAELYAAVARQSENLKTNQKGLLLYTENIAKALAIQHTTMQAARGPLLQLGQAMASGKIRAQEFNSIMLGLPYVMKVVAENFKGGSISVMQLRQMMLQGKLESVEFFNAFQRGTQQINDDFNKTQVTFSQAFTIFKNELIKFTGTMDSTTGASAKFAAVLKFVAENIALLSGALLALSVGVKFGPVIAGFVAMRAESAAAAAAVSAANVQMAATEAASAAAALNTARASVAKTEAELANARATQATILVTREAAIATLAKANSDIAAARASLQAATNAGALSYALAVKREAEIALTAAELRRTATLTELAALGQAQARSTVIQTEATVAHTAAVRALAVAQGLGAESAAAYGVAQTAAAAATGRVGIAAGAATMATRLFSGAVALMGGPIGVAITALVALGLWLYNVKSKADDAREAIEAVNRVNAAKQGGAGVRQSDAEKIQAAQNLAQKELEEAQDKLAKLEKNIAQKRADGRNDVADRLDATFGNELRKKISDSTAQVEKFSKAMEDAKNYSAETGGAAGYAARQVSQARGAWEASIGSVKTATTIQEKYTEELETSRKAHKDYIAQLKANNAGGVNDAEIQRAISLQAEAEQSMLKTRDAALKALRNKGVEHTRQVQLEADERMSIIQNSLENEVSVRKQAYESDKRMLDAKHQNGLMSEAEFMAQNLQMVQRYEQEERAIVERNMQAYKSAYEERRAYIIKTLDGKREKDALTLLDAEYAKFVESTNAKLSKLSTSAFERQTTAIYKLNGELKSLAAQDDKYWRQAEANMDKEQAVAEAKRKLAFATEEQQAAYEAYIRTGEQHNAQLEKLELAYDKARREADDFSASIDWREAGDETILILGAMNDKADEFANRLNAAYATLEGLKQRAAAAAAESVRNREFNRNVEQVSDAIETAIFEGGKAGGKKFTDWLKNYFLRNPLKVLIQGTLSVIGNALGMGNNGAIGGSMNLLSLWNAGSQLFKLGSQFLAGTMSGANVLGTTFANATGTGLDGLLMTNGAYGTAASGGSMSGLMGGGIAAAVAAVVLNALGAFRSEKKVGSGLRGTLGKEGGVTPWEEWRKGGTLFSGPSYSTMNPVEELRSARKRLKELQDMQTRGELSNPQQLYTQQSIVDKLEAEYGKLADSAEAQDRAIQKAFGTMKDNVVKMGEILGLSTEKLKAFTTQLGGSDKGLNFQGMNDEQIQAKIMEALDTANNEMAQQIIGTWETTTTRVTRLIKQVDGAGEDAVTTYHEVEETITNTRYVASEYAREGEKAIDTLTRLATSLDATNRVFDTLGQRAFEASLAGADLASKLVDLFGGIEGFTNATNAYYESMYSKEERAAIAQRQLEEEFRKQGLTLPKTREEYRKLVDSQDLTTESGRKMYHFLIMLGPAFAALADDARDAAQVLDDLSSATDKAFSTLESVINREIAALEASKTAIQQTLAAATEIFNIFDSAFTELMGTIESAIAMSYTEGRAFIENAAKNPNAPIDSKAAQRAIAGINGGLSTDNFSSKLDYDRERLTIAGQYEKIRDSAKEQMTVAEQQLEGINTQIDRLNDMLKMAKEQLDAMRGIHTATMSVNEAILAFHSAWAAENVARNKNPDGTTGGAGAKPGFGPGDNGSGNFSAGPGGSGGAVKEIKPGMKTDDGKYYVEQYLGPYGSVFNPAAADQQTRLQSIEGAAQKAWADATASGNVADLFNELKAQGITLTEAAAIYGFYYKDVYDASVAAGVGRFANGGDHYGGLRWVGERGPELEATGSARIWNQSQMGRALALGVSQMQQEDTYQSEDGASMGSGEASSASYKFQRETMISIKKIEGYMKKNDTLGMPPTRTEEAGA